MVAYALFSNEGIKDGSTGGCSEPFRREDVVVAVGLPVLLKDPERLDVVAVLALPT